MDDDEYCVEQECEDAVEEDQDGDEEDKSPVALKKGKKSLPVKSLPRRRLDEGADELVLTIDSGSIVKGDLGSSNFYMKTPDVGAMASLMYAMSGLVKALRIYISDEGMSISEGVARDNMFLFVKFRKSQFEEFKNDGECVVCFDPMDMYQCIRGHQQRDVMYWEFDRKSPKKLTIGLLRNGGDLHTFKCSITLFGCVSQVYTAPPEEVDYVLAFDTGVVVKIVSTLFEMRKSFDNMWIAIDCCKESVTFSKNGGHMMPRVSFQLKTGIVAGDEEGDDGAGEKKRRRKNKQDQSGSIIDTDCVRKIEQKRVIHEYHLMDLHRLQKCFAINHGYVLMYIKEDFPLVLEIKVGTLGVLRAVLMHRQPDCDDEEEQ